MDNATILEIFSLLWRVFPLVPAAAMVIALVPKYLIGWDWTRAMVPLTLGLQLVLGVIIILTALTQPAIPQSLTLPLSTWDYGIVFRYEAVKLYFLGALLIPTGFALFTSSSISSPEHRLIFLLYLTGCSGLVMTGDVFNFFVFYEVMIMGAYVLISIQGEFGASIKYMIIGSISSALFLGGIVLLYASGAYFGFTFVDTPAVAASFNLTMAMTLFLLAFFIKAAFFPASAWVASCHSAANPLVSAYLAGFTIFSGIIGLYYFVLVPAQLLDKLYFFEVLRVVSLVTIPAAAFFLFWETRLKRAIAASTVFTVGIVGLLLSYQEYSLAFTYILVHGFYKSLLFLLYGSLVVRKRIIGISIAGVITLLIGLVFTLGLFPSIPYFLKSGFLHSVGLYKRLFTLAVFLLAGGFVKFRFRLISGARGIWILFGGILTLLLLYIAAFLGILPADLVVPALKDLVPDLLALVLGLVMGRFVFSRLPALRDLDSRIVFADLNQELLIILLFCGGVGAWIIGRA